MNLHEYYHYLQQLPQQVVAMLQMRNTQQNTTPPVAGQAKRNKRKLVRKNLSHKRKP